MKRSPLLRHGTRSARLALMALATATLPALAQNVTLTDQNGRTFRVPNKTERIASLVIPGASMVLTLDQSTQRLVGIHPSARSDITHGLLGQLFPAAERIPANMSGEGFAPNIEALMNARPDVVLQWGDRGDAILKPLDNMGLNVLTLKYGQTDYVATWLRLMGQATGKGERGEKLARWIEEEQRSIQQQVATIPPEKRLKVLFLYRFHGGIQVAGSGTNMDTDIRLVGGINVATHTKGQAQVSKEQIVAWDPDVILLTNFDPQLTAEDLRKDPLLSGVKAVKTNRLYRVPRGGFRWDPPSQETPLAWRWQAGLLHPTVFPLKDFRQRIRDTYRELYAANVTEADIDKVLHLSLNRGTPGYADLVGGAR